MGSSALAKAFYDKQRLVLVEPLGANLRLGSVGYFSKGQWVEVGTTQSMFGFRLASSNGSAEPNSFDGSGGKGYSFDVKAAGSVSTLVPNEADAKARAEVSFGSQDGFVMSVRNQRVKTAQDLAELMAAIRWAYRNRRRLGEGKRWERKYSVVVGVATAASVTAVSARSANAAIVVEGSGNLAAPQTEAQLRAKMKITRTRESVDKLWKGPASGYAVQALRLEPSIWKRWDREDFTYNAAYAPRALVKRDAGGQGRLSRPSSYAAWVRAEGLADPRNVPTELLRGSGRATIRGPASKITKPGFAARAVQAELGGRARVTTERISVTTTTGRKAITSVGPTKSIVPKAGRKPTTVAGSTKATVSKTTAHKPSATPVPSLRGVTGRRGR